MATLSVNGATLAVPPVAPAVCNAVRRLVRTRVEQLPLHDINFSSPE